MPDIKYVCLSDMHLGAQNSLLTNLTLDCSDTAPRVASPILVQLVECLRTLVSQNESTEKPTLILNGDILELALTTDNEAAMVFERFIELIFPAQNEWLFKNIVFLPGNHDHHLWETARETQYIQYIAGTETQKKIEPGSLLDIPWHTTKMFEPDPVPATFLNGIIKRYPHLTKEEITTVYPNYAVLTQDASHCAIFSHGHFIESMYMLMSQLRQMMFPKEKAPGTIYDIESQNFAWIDFFWSTMGRSGEVGVDVERVYDSLQNKDALKRIVANIAEGIDKRYNLPGWDRLDRKIIEQLLGFFLFHVAHVERAAPEVLLGTDTRQGLINYIEGPVLDQLINERKANVPPNVTFIFGHTHKPFEEDINNVNGYPPWLRVYNSGGWVVDTTDCQKLHGGAVILLDENLDSTSLRMYNEAPIEEDYVIRVEAATHPNAAPNPFHERIAGMIDPTKNPWKLFSELVFKGIPMRCDNLKQHIVKN